MLCFVLLVAVAAFVLAAAAVLSLDVPLDVGRVASLYGALLAHVGDDLPSPGAWVQFRTDQVVAFVCCLGVWQS